MRESAAMQRRKKQAYIRCAYWLSLILLVGSAGCSGSLYKVKQKVDAPIPDGKGATASGFSVRAVPLLTDEESQELFEANLPLGGLLPIKLEIKNESGAPLSFKRVRFRLRDSELTWKLRSPKQAVSRILKNNAVYLYNPNSRKAFEEAVREHSFDIEAPLGPARQRRGLIFFQAPKNEQVASPRGLTLTIEGLPQPVEVIFN